MATPFPETAASPDGLVSAIPMKDALANRLEQLVSKGSWASASDKAEALNVAGKWSDLEEVLRRNGFVRCDLMACNCGSWHARYGLPERMAEIKEALSNAGHPLRNENGNLVSNALAELIAERDALLAATEPAPMKDGAHSQSDTEIARKIMARLCDQGDVRMSIPMRNEDEDMVLSRVIKAAEAVPGLLAALQQIANWELPPTGKYWDAEQTRPTSYEAEYGSNGARSYMRALARAAVARATGKETS